MGNHLLKLPKLYLIYRMLSLLTSIPLVLIVLIHMAKWFSGGFSEIFAMHAHVALIGSNPLELDKAMIDALIHSQIQFTIMVSAVSGLLALFFAWLSNIMIRKNQIQG